MWDYYNRHSEYVKTPYEKCKELFISIRLEQKKRHPDSELLTKWMSELWVRKISIVMSAFDAVVDENGW